jgi:hypothetical protein
MSHRPALKPQTSIIGLSLYVGFLATLAAGSGACVYAAFQPVKLPNPGLAAYHPPPAVELIPPASAYSTEAPVVEAASAQPAGVAGTAGLRTADASSQSAGSPHAEGAVTAAESARAQERPDKKTAHAHSHTRDSNAKVAATQEWGKSSSASWSSQWPPQSAQSYAQWRSQDARPRWHEGQQQSQQGKQGSQQGNARGWGHAPSMTFAQFGSSRPW